MFRGLRIREAHITAMACTVTEPRGQGRLEVSPRQDSGEGIRSLAAGLSIAFVRRAPPPLSSETQNRRTTGSDLTMRLNGARPRERRYLRWQVPGRRCRAREDDGKRRNARRHVETVGSLGRLMNERLELAFCRGPLSPAGAATKPTRRSDYTQRVDKGDSQWPGRPRSRQTAAQRAAP